MIKESCKDKTFRIIVTVILCIFAGISIVPLLTVVAMSFSSKAASDMNIGKRRITPRIPCSPQLCHN